MAGPSYGAIGQADALPPYEEPVYDNVDGGEGPRRDAQPVVRGGGSPPGRAARSAAARPSQWGRCPFRAGKL